MTHRVTLRPSGRTFDNHPGESLLESALANGLPVDYGCSNGNCGKCRARRVEGEVTRLRHSDFAFAAADAAAGWFLLCCHGAATDLVLDTGVALDSGDIEWQEIDVKVRKVSAIDASATLLHVQTPRTRRLRFLAGQWARLGRDGVSFELPIASCPCDDRNLHFHVSPGSDLLDALRAGDVLRLSGPIGDFVLDAESRRPRLMVGAGAGMAPLKSIIEHSQSLDGDIPVWLLLVEDEPGSHYLGNLLRSWRDALDTFDFAVATSDAVAAAIDGFAQGGGAAPADCDWYVCGPSALVTRVTGHLSRLCIPPAQLHAEAV